MRGFDVNRFVEERTPVWTRLEQMLKQVERNGLASLSLAAARDFGKLYRAVSSDLIRARTEIVNATIVDYLNDVVARAYAVMHTTDDSQERHIVRFFTRRFPRTFRREWRAVVMAAVILFSGAGVGATAVALDPHSLGALIPDGHQARTPRERVGRENDRGGTVGGNQAVAFSGWLFTHNIQVSFLVFALGLTFGVGTVAVLFYNGVPLGALAMQYHLSGMGTFFWAWILPHGVAEMTEICIAGAAGLIIARGLWLPGRRRRQDAVIEEARTAATLVIGGMPILVLAGVIEGTISQMHEPALPYAAKLFFALLVAVAVYYYLLYSGRGADDTTVSDSEG